MPDLDVLVVDSLSAFVMVMTVVIVVVETVSCSDTSTVCSGGDGGGEAVADVEAATTLGALI